LLHEPIEKCVGVRDGFDLLRFEVDSMIFFSSSASFLGVELGP